LIHGLDLPDAEIRANIIDTLYVSAEALTEEKKTQEQSAVSEHASTLVSIMLKNSRVKDVASVVRNFPA
jgi:DNA repair/transcription protein MET18/MMS19